MFHFISYGLFSGVLASLHIFQVQYMLYVSLFYTPLFCCSVSYQLILSKKSHYCTLCAAADREGFHWTRIVRTSDLQSSVNIVIIRINRLFLSVFGLLVFAIVMWFENEH